MRRKSPFAQCLVEFNKPDGSLHGESWLFHMDAAFEDTRRRADRGEGAAAGGDWNWGRIGLISPKCQFFMGKMIEQWFWASQFSQKTMSIDGLAADRNAAVGVDSYPYSSIPDRRLTQVETGRCDLLAKIFVVSQSNNSHIFVCEKQPIRINIVDFPCRFWYPRLIYQIFGRVSIQVLPLALFSADFFSAGLRRSRVSLDC